MHFPIQVSDKDNIQVLDLLITTYYWFNLMNIARQTPIYGVSSSLHVISSPPLHKMLLFRKNPYLPIICHFNAQHLKCIDSGTVDDIPIRIKTGPVTWAYKSGLILLQSAAQMSAGQAQGRESAFSVDKKRGDLWNRCP